MGQRSARKTYNFTRSDATPTVRELAASNVTFSQVYSNSPEHNSNVNPQSAAVMSPKSIVSTGEKPVKRERTKRQKPPRSEPIAAAMSQEVRVEPVALPQQIVLPDHPVDSHSLTEPYRGTPLSSSWEDAKPQGGAEAHFVHDPVIPDQTIGDTVEHEMVEGQETCVPTEQEEDVTLEVQTCAKPADETLLVMDRAPIVSTESQIVENRDSDAEDSGRTEVRPYVTKVSGDTARASRQTPLPSVKEEDEMSEEVTKPQRLSVSFAGVPPVDEADGDEKSSGNRPRVDSYTSDVQTQPLQRGLSFREVRFEAADSIGEVTSSNDSGGSPEVTDHVDAHVSDDKQTPEIVVKAKGKAKSKAKAKAKSKPKPKAKASAAGKPPTPGSNA